MAKGAGYGLFNHHFAQLAHDHKGNETGDGVTENNPRACRLNNGSAAEKQARADSAAQSDQLYMAVLQAALKLGALLLTFHCETSCVVIIVTLFAYVLKKFRFLYCYVYEKLFLKRGKALSSSAE